MNILPYHKDEQGVLRFKENSIIAAMMAMGSKGQCFDLNTLQICRHVATIEDRIIFDQLMGWPLSAFGGFSQEHSYIEEVVYKQLNDGLSLTETRAIVAEERLNRLKTLLKPIIVELFDIHEDDL